jgi:hypothetical protein
LPGEDARTALRGRAGKNHDEVRAEGVDRFLNRLRGAVADGDDDDHAAHADDDAEHGEERAQLVARDRFQSDDGDVAEAVE